MNASDRAWLVPSAARRRTNASTSNLFLPIVRERFPGIVTVKTESLRHPSRAAHGRLAGCPDEQSAAVASTSAYASSILDVYPATTSTSPPAVPAPGISVGWLVPLDPGRASPAWRSQGVGVRDSLVPE